MNSVMRDLEQMELAEIEPIFKAIEEIRNARLEETQQGKAKRLAAKQLENDAIMAFCISVMCLFIMCLASIDPGKEAIFFMALVSSLLACHLSMTMGKRSRCELDTKLDK